MEREIRFQNNYCTVQFIRDQLSDVKSYGYVEGRKNKTDRTGGGDQQNRRTTSRLQDNRRSNRLIPRMSTTHEIARM